MPARVTLTFTDGTLKGAVIPFEQRTTCLIGKASNCNLRLPADPDHRTISRHHCLLDINPPRIRIRDFGSRNGTFVNGEKIGQRSTLEPKGSVAVVAQERDLKDGDEIQLGARRVVVMRVAVTNPPTCLTCGIEVQDTEAGLTPPVQPGAFQCPTCQKTGNTTVDMDYSSRAGLVCICCGKDVSAENPTRGRGNYLCSGCKGHPSQLVHKVLEAARNGDRELEAFRDLEFVRDLGKGGMGSVHLMRDRTNGLQFALKVMLPDMAVAEKAKQLFLREIELTRLLNHPRVVRLHRVGSGAGAFFFTMDFCEGGNVRSLMAARGGPLPLDEAAAITIQALDGLEYAHTLPIEGAPLPGGGTGRVVGLVHRDLKPQNIFLGKSASPYLVKVGDYGLAKAFDTAGLSGLTCTGAVAGTPHFMPRQQVIDFRYSRPEVDVWGMAATFYFMLTGFPPRDFHPGRDVWQTVLQTKPIPLALRKPSIPPRVAQLVDYALQDDPEVTFKTAREFHLELEKVL